MIFKNNKVYDVLKWIVCIGLHGLNYLWSELASVWGFPYAAEISRSISIIAVALGIWLGISSVKYNLTMKEEENAKEVMNGDA